MATTLLIDFACDQNPGPPHHRPHDPGAPLFDAAPFELRGRRTAPGRCELWAVTREGTVAMSAEVERA
jgi:hydroxyacyl-ACP dehydratase HTD2-like protein with hotdog domain